jgi:hypothetical protein
MIGIMACIGGWHEASFFLSTATSASSISSQGGSWVALKVLEIKWLKMIPRPAAFLRLSLLLPSRFGGVIGLGLVTANHLSRKVQWH